MALQTLAGITVLDLCSYLAGPYAAALLGDMGADVIKIESPGGDMLRHYPSTLSGESRAFVGTNRNKRSIVLDLKTTEGLALCHKLVQRADVVIQNFRPGVAERLGLGYEALLALNPRLVYASFTGYGEDGPNASNPGFDQVLQCMTGVAKAQGFPGNEPKVVWGSVLDFYGASMLAMAISAALFNREKTGQPQTVEASLLASSMALQAGRMVWAENEERGVERDLRGGGLSAIHPAREGHIYVQAQTQPFWEALCELTGLSHLASDPRYDDMRKRKTHEDELVPQLRQALMARTALEWEALFGSRVPCAAVREGVDMFDHPQVAAQGLVTTHEHPTLGRYRAMGNPVTINGRAQRIPDRRAPMLGEHTQAVLTELGLGQAEIAELQAQGCVA